jgi:ribosomal protein S27E
MTNKKAANTEEAGKVQERYEGKPHGWIQWKGTSVCMDIHCKCGHHSHIDADFAYNVKCPKCGTVYHCNPHVELIELENEPSSSVVTAEC